MDTDRQNQDQDEEQTRQVGQQSGQQTNQRQDSGLPGGGVGRREEPGQTGVYTISSPQGASPDAPLENENAWGQGKRGAAGYNDSGDSEAEQVSDSTGEGERNEE